MIERYVIEKIGFGWYTGIHYDGTGKPAFYNKVLCVKDSMAQLFRGESDAYSRLNTLRNDYSESGVFVITKIILVP